MSNISLSSWHISVSLHDQEEQKKDNVDYVLSVVYLDLKPTMKKRDDGGQRTGHRHAVQTSQQDVEVSSQVLIVPAPRALLSELPGCLDETY
jgi:hypothetical protein